MEEKYYSLNEIMKMIQDECGVDVSNCKKRIKNILKSLNVNINAYKTGKAKKEYAFPAEIAAIIMAFTTESGNKGNSLVKLINDKKKDKVSSKQWLAFLNKVAEIHQILLHSDSISEINKKFNKFVRNYEELEDESGVIYIDESEEFNDIGVKMNVMYFADEIKKTAEDGLDLIYKEMFDMIPECEMTYNSILQALQPYKKEEDYILDIDYHTFLLKLSRELDEILLKYRYSIRLLKYVLDDDSFKMKLDDKGIPIENVFFDILDNQDQLEYDLSKVKRYSGPSTKEIEDSFPDPESALAFVLRNHQSKKILSPPARKRIFKGRFYADIDTTNWDDIADAIKSIY